MRKQEVISLVDGVLNSVENGIPYDTHLGYDFLTEDQRKQVEQLQKGSYKLFMDSWVVPKLKRVRGLVDGTISYPRRRAGVQAAADDAATIAMEYNLRKDDSDEYFVTIGGVEYEAFDVKEVLQDVREESPEQIEHQRMEQEHGALFRSLMYSSLITRQEPFRLKNDGRRLLTFLQGVKELDE